MLLLLAASPFAVGADSGAWRGLDVRVESIAEPMLVDGLPILVSRVTGGDVDQVAKRLAEKWTRESGVIGVRSETHGAWTILSRLLDTGLEVAQWHGTGGDAELLWSRSEFSGSVRSPPRGIFRFPAGCVPGRTVSGRVDARKYWQRAALCRGAPRQTLAAVRKSAGSEGFEVLSRDGQLLARSGNIEVTVFAWPSGGLAAGSTSLVYLQVDYPERAP